MIKIQFFILVFFIQLYGQQESSDYISLKRGPCYGPCPVYTVTIYSDGTVHYTGEKFVKVTGHREYKIPEDSAAYLFKKANEIDIFSFKDEYREGRFIEKKENNNYDTLRYIITDKPTYTVTIKLGDEQKSIIDYFRVRSSNPHYEELKKYEAPQSLKDLELEIDRIAGTEKFIKK